jgi:hypothetical protein
MARKKPPANAALLENLITLNELIARYKGQWKRSTIYCWVCNEGMPHRKLRGRLWFNPDETDSWIERTSE